MTRSLTNIAFEAESRRFEILSSGDFGELEHLLADELHYTHANGLVEDKAEFIRKLVSGERRYTDVKLLERSGLEQAGFVLTYGSMILSVLGASGPLDIHTVYTGVYLGPDCRLLAWSGVKI